MSSRGRPREEDIGTVTTQANFVGKCRYCGTRNHESKNEECAVPSTACHSCHPPGVQLIKQESRASPSPGTREVKEGTRRRWISLALDGVSAPAREAAGIPFQAAVQLCATSPDNKLHGRMGEKNKEPSSGSSCSVISCHTVSKGSPSGRRYKAKM